MLQLLHCLTSVLLCRLSSALLYFYTKAFLHFCASEAVVILNSCFLKYRMWSLSKNSLRVTLNLFQGLPELALGLKQVQHEILHCIIF